MTLQESHSSRRRGRHTWLWMGVVLVATTLAGATGWAVATLLRPSEDPLEATSFTFVTVTHGEVGASISLSSSAEWKPTPAGSNQASGVVTGVSIASGDEVGQGTVLYLVNQRPVVAAQGNVPAYRAIEEGAEGADVLQLQQMLQS